MVLTDSLMVGCAVIVVVVLLMVSVSLVTRWMVRRLSKQFVNLLVRETDEATTKQTHIKISKCTRYGHYNYTCICKFGLVAVCTCFICSIANSTSANNGSV